MNDAPISNGDPAGEASQSPPLGPRPNPARTTELRALDGVGAASSQAFELRPSVSHAVRTLFTAGFIVTNCTRQHRHAELLCERQDVFGATVSYLIVICEDEEPPVDAREEAARAAARERRVLLVVAANGGADWVAWPEFLEMLGGGVPSWRALGPSFAGDICCLATNQLPDGMRGEAWRLFEEAVADGLEFVFARRVRRLGGAARGRRLSDLLAHTPDGRLLVVDAKATGSAFDASWPNLRALAEYVKAQQRRQTGSLQVAGTLVVAPAFQQDAHALIAVGSEFLADTRVPAAFVPVSTLVLLVERLAATPLLRGALNWAGLLCRPGIVSAEAVDREIRFAQLERVERDALQHHVAGSRNGGAAQARSDPPEEHT